MKIFEIRFIVKFGKKNAKGSAGNRLRKMLRRYMADANRNK